MDMMGGRTAAAAIGKILASLVCLLAANLAHANDSAAAIAAGGLELVKNDQVRMVSEALRIGPGNVEVNYVFENTSSADLTTEIAFPLPDLNLAEAYHVPLAISFRGGANFVGFRVWIDGQEIKPNMEVRAFGKSEITNDLKRLGVDLVDPVLKDPRVIDALRRLDAIGDDGPNDLYALWTTKVTFHWSQTFPAGKRVAIRHSYGAIVGHFYKVNDDPRTRITKKDQELGGQWCFDQSFNAAELRLLDRKYEAARSGKPDKFNMSYINVEYVLKTGANWKGPIGRFELQIEKGGAELVSTCPIPGLQLKRTPYGFNAVATNYTPSTDLDILFVSNH
jgi:hypothetical protein